VKASVILSGIVAVAALGAALWQWRTAEALRAENVSLRAQFDASQAPSASSEDTQKRDAELLKLRAEAQELVRLRGEVTRLRLATNETDRLRAENRQLRSDNGQLRAASTAAPFPAPAKPAGVFAKHEWTFTGYKTPEDALVSAIWSMHQGNPRQYFESLTPDEQARMTKAWEGKSPEEIAAKHKSDTSPITGIRVMEVVNSDLASGNEVMMTVMIEGVNRQELVRMQRVGEEWKFGGFIREPKR
jgi:hypothetical protein